MCGVYSGSTIKVKASRRAWQGSGRARKSAGPSIRPRHGSPDDLAPETGWVQCAPRQLLRRGVPRGMASAGRGEKGRAIPIHGTGDVPIACGNFLSLVPSSWVLTTTAFLPAYRPWSNTTTLPAFMMLEIVERKEYGPGVKSRAQNG